MTLAVCGALNHNNNNNNNNNNKNVLANILGYHKQSRRWSWRSPDGIYYNQIDYILVIKRFRSGIRFARTRYFTGADVKSDNDMVMMTFRKLKGIPNLMKSQEVKKTNQAKNST